MRSILFLLLVHYCMSLHAQYFPRLVFQKFYGKKTEDTAVRLVKAGDGQLIIGGNTETFNADGKRQTNVWIIKVDTTGQEIWEREIYMDGSQEMRDMVVDEEGGIVFAGVTNGLLQHTEAGDPAFGGDFFVGKIDPYGQILWVKSYGGKQIDQAYGICLGQYREYAIVGGSHSSDGEVGQNFGVSDVWLLKLDTQGNKRASKVMGGSGNDWGTAITPCENGDYLIAGYTNSPDLGGGDLSSLGNGLVIRVNQAGQQLWSRSFACRQGGHFSAITEAKNGEIVLAGFQENPVQKNEFWILRLDAQGKQLSESVFGGVADDRLTTLEPAADGGFYFGGFSSRHFQGDYAKGGDDFWLIRTDSLGKVIWRDTYGGPNHERCKDILAYRPGVFFALGEKVNDFSQPADSKGKDFWLLRFDEIPCDSIAPSIYVRVKKNKTERDLKIRFKARHNYGERFLWDFGDGTKSEEENPLKSYSLPGMYTVKLSVFVNEGCRQSVRREKQLEVH